MAFRFVLLSFALALAGPAAARQVATDPGAPADPVPAKHGKKAVDPNRKICRREVVTGSMMAQSQCHTAAEWREMDAANAAEVEQSRMHTPTAAGVAR